MISLRDIARAWNRFFFEPISPLPIAVYRVFLGFFVLLNQLLLLPDVNVWFGLRGAVTFETARHMSGGTGFNLLNYLPQNSAMVWLMFLASCLLAISLMLGFYTRTSAGVLFVTLVTLHHRDPIILNSGDTFLRIATFYMMFSHAGKAVSVDRLLARKRGEELGPIASVPPWAMRLIQLQLAFLYLYAFVWKAMGVTWLSGTAVYYTSRLVEFWRFPVPYVYEHMWTIKLWTWFTLVVEFALGTAVWVKELRYPILIAGLLLHIGIDYSMNIPLFGFIMVSAYVTFIEPAHLQAVVARFKKPARQSGLATIAN